MNRTFQIMALVLTRFISLILTPFVLSKWLTVDFSRFNEGEIQYSRF